MKGFRTSCSFSFPELSCRKGRLRQAALRRTESGARLFRALHPISNSRLIALDGKGVTFKCKDYRIKGRDRLKTMTLDPAEFIRRFLLHVLPSGFHRIRHYGLIAGAVRAHNIERVRQLLTASTQPRESERAEADNETETPPTARRCPCCGGRMIIINTFEGARPAQSPSPTRIRIDTS